jgi:hypothetical protein
MRLSLETSILLILAILLSINFFHSGVEATPGVEGNTTVKIITYINFIVFITCVLSIKQFFWPGEVIRFSYHLANIIFVIAFYALSFRYLVTNKDYYEGFGYTGLSDTEVIKRFAMRMDAFSIMFWFCCLAVLFNILYIIRYRSRYLRHD